MGALDRTYLHSAITESLWYAVTESENMFMARLSHAVMLSSMYGNPDASLSEGNEQIHEMYVRAITTMPYIRAKDAKGSRETDELIEEWRRLNSETDKKDGEDGR